MQELLVDDLVVTTLVLPQQLSRLRAKLFDLQAIVQEHYDEQGQSVVDIRIARVELNRLLSHEGLAAETFLQEYTKSH